MGHRDQCFRNQECRLGSSSVRVILCHHTVMSQGDELLPGIVAHLWCGREREVTIYFIRTAGWPQSTGNHSAGNGRGTE